MFSFVQITLITADGRNVALPLKNFSSLPLECITTESQNTPEKIMLINEAEVTSWGMWLFSLC